MVHSQLSVSLSLTLLILNSPLIIVSEDYPDGFNPKFPCQNETWANKTSSLGRCWHFQFDRTNLVGSSENNDTSSGKETAAVGRTEAEKGTPMETVPLDEGQEVVEATTAVSTDGISRTVARTEKDKPKNSSTSVLREGTPCEITFEWYGDKDWEWFAIDPCQDEENRNFMECVLDHNPDAPEKDPKAIHKGTCQCYRDWTKGLGGPHLPAYDPKKKWEVDSQIWFIWNNFTGDMEKEAECWVKKGMPCAPVDRDIVPYRCQGHREDGKGGRCIAEGEDARYKYCSTYPIPSSTLPTFEGGVLKLVYLLLSVHYCLPWFMG